MGAAHGLQRADQVEEAKRVFAARLSLMVLRVARLSDGRRLFGGRSLPYFPADLPYRVMMPRSRLIVAGPCSRCA